MTDPFVDDLFDKLHAERQKTLSLAASATQSRERTAQAARVWWEEFGQVLERKVHAWNAKDAPDAHVTYTRMPAGSIRIWHGRVEAELSLVEQRVVMTGRVGDTRPRESPFIEFSEARGSVAAVRAGSHGTTSPVEAADHLLAPLLTHAFAGS
jgi:hypothetical protein